MGFLSKSVADGYISEHQQYAPMWVVKVGDVLKMTDRFPPHQVLKAEGLLDKWRADMFTIFVSHQWLGYHHPDPDGLQMKVLQSVLLNLVTRKLQIETDLISQWNSKRLTKEQLGRLEGAHIWLDYFCVPQLLDRYESHGMQEQMLYVDSIPSYVQVCNLFFALVPQTAHHDSKAACSLHSWLQRGWCRTELWCHSLSAQAKAPIVVVKDHDRAQFTAPMWHRYPVHLGDFAFEKDRASCSRVMQKALTLSLPKLREAKDKTPFRLYLSLFEDMTGLPAKHRNVEDFLSEFAFSEPLQQYRGLGPIACAALSVDHKLIHDLVVAKASLETRAPSMPETMNLPDFRPLHLAVWFRSHDLRVLQTLLELRADPNSSSMNICPALGLCRAAGAVELLVAHGAEVNFLQKGVSSYRLIESAPALSPPCEVLAKLLELQADVTDELGRVSPLHSIAISGDSSNDLKSAQLLICSRANINHMFRPKGMARGMEMISRAYTQCRGKPGMVVRFFRDVSTTPVGWCAILDNEGLLTFLLRARADPEIKNNRGLRAIDIARSEKIRAILSDPTPHIYGLEHQSEMVTEVL